MVTISVNNGKVKLDSIHRNLLDLIPFGSENAISMSKLSYISGYEPREIRKIVLECRIKGCVIGSGTCGYFIPVNEMELRSYYNTASARSRSCAISLHSTRKLIKSLGEQNDADNM